MAIENELLDKLLADYKKPEDILGENGLLKQLTKALLERAMNAETERAPRVCETRSGRLQERELAQRHDEEDPEGRLRRNGVGDAARPERELRAEDRSEGADPCPACRPNSRSILSSVPAHLQGERQSALSHSTYPTLTATCNHSTQKRQLGGGIGEARGASENFSVQKVAKGGAEYNRPAPGVSPLLRT